MEPALTYTLQRFHWQLFCTLTFKSARLPERLRVSMFFAWVRTFCAWYRVPFRDVIWCLRQESGELTGRLHLHALICGLPPFAVQEGTCFALMAQWEKLGGGMARVRVFDATQSGVAYIVKCLNPSGAANLYETGKFSGSVDSVMCSNSMWTVANAAHSSHVPSETAC